MASKTSIPKGTRDFSAIELAKRNYIIQIIKTNFEKYGYQPIETPSFENSETLMGKYGEEGDRLIFKILNSGDYLEKINISELNTYTSKQLTPKIAEKALRYDLTVPFARYVVQHQSELYFPFKRYQIQPVWRADRPQKGRFREFYQCDADVIGSTSLWQETELLLLYDAVFTDLDLKGVTLKINNRKILSGIAEVIGATDKLLDFTVALDKLDKIGEEGVKKEMLEKGISELAIEKVQPLFNFTGSIQERIDKLSTLLSASLEGRNGIAEIQFIYNQISKIGLQTSTLDLDVTLARGLNYYTGAIFEVAPPKTVAMGSIGGGGRYDDLTGIFGLKNMSGVGISFGLDRIYLVVDELSLFPNTITTSLKILFLNSGENTVLESLQTIQKLRNLNIQAELYPDTVKMDKQFKFAEKSNFMYVMKEVKEGQYSIKNLLSGEQSVVDFDTLVCLLEKN